MLIVMDGESVRDYHDSVGQFDRGQIPPPSLAGKGAGGLGFPKRASGILLGEGLGERSICITYTLNLELIRFIASSTFSRLLNAEIRK
jgi:hypothetical protein